MKMEQSPIYHRIPIDLLKKGEFRKGEGWNSNHVLVDDIPIFKVNLIGTVISKDATQRFPSCIIDDTTTHIQIRSFEPTTLYDDIEMGTLVRVLGSVRMYADEVYLVPSCIHKIQRREVVESHRSSAQRWLKRPKSAPKVVVQEELKSEQPSYIQILRSLDTGQGVPTGEFRRHITHKEPDKIIRDLISQGEIFEARPGILKSLF
jgi:hypothetical protein